MEIKNTKSKHNKVIIHEFIVKLLFYVSTNNIYKQLEIKEKETIMKKNRVLNTIMNSIKNFWCKNVINKIIILKCIKGK